MIDAFTGMLMRRPFLSGSYMGTTGRLQFNEAVAGPILPDRDAQSGGGLFVPEG
jgi:hypothetical protein